MRRLFFSLKAVSKGPADRKHQLAPGRMGGLGEGVLHMARAGSSWARRVLGGARWEAVRAYEMGRRRAVLVDEEADCGGVGGMGCW